ncbi:MAG: N-acetyltransferase family protein [Desulfobacteraceae bacterium]
MGAAERPLTEMEGEYPKEIILRDGRGVSLRPLGPEDGPLLRRMLERLTEEDLWFLGLGEPVPGFVEKWVNEAGKDRLFTVCAVLEGEMVAAAALIRERPGAEGHVGRIQTSVIPAYREKKLGTWMLFDLINAAMSMGLERLIMRMVEGRDASLMRAMEKLGFTREAVLKDFIKDRAGNYRDLVLMVKRLPFA